MNIVIAHNRVKRTISGTGFNICGSKDDLLRIAEELRRRCADDFEYGWVAVRDLEMDEHASDTKPIPWGAA